MKKDLFKAFFEKTEFNAHTHSMCRSYHTILINLFFLNVSIAIKKLEYLNWSLFCVHNFMPTYELNV